MTPKEWYNMTIGKSYDTDNYPSYWKWQCWDYIDYFKRYNKLNKFSTYCALTGYAGDIWKLRWSNGATEYFDFVSPSQLISGDWIFYDRHVAFVYEENGKLWEVGQNQLYPKNTVTKMNLNRNGILGGFRWRGWTVPDHGVADKFSLSFQNSYIATAPVNIRTGGSVKYKSLGVLPKGDKLTCYGYYTIDEKGRTWLYVTCMLAGKMVTGFVCYNYISILRR